MARAKALRSNCNFLPRSSFLRRRAHFNDKQQGVLVDTEKAKSGATNPMMDPFMMMNMMKQNMAMIIPNVVLMGWISYFFSGFVIVKIPFPLTNAFKMMMQRGIDLKSLNPSYVSSLSWYFITMFGLRGVFSLILGENNETDDAKMMQQQMQMGGAMGGGPDVAKMFQGERENLELVHHKWAVEEAEARLLTL